MKLDCDTWYRNLYAGHIRRQRRLQSWRPGFAWLPVNVGYKDCRWLEPIEKRRRRRGLYASLYPRGYANTYIVCWLFGEWSMEYRCKQN